MNEIVVRLRDSAATAWRAGTDPGQITALQAVLTRVGAELKPQHPGALDPELQSWFTISTESPERAEEIAESLRSLDAVEAAYVQPRSSPA